MRHTTHPRAIKKARQGRGLSEAWRAEPQARESSDSPRLKAFCRVAPSVRLSVLAMLSARVFFRESVFNVRTSDGVHERRFEFLGINISEFGYYRSVSSRISPKRKGKNVKPVASIDVFYFCECSREAQIELGTASLGEPSKTHSKVVFWSILGTGACL